MRRAEWPGVRVLLVGTGAYPIPPAGYGAIERILAEYAQALEAAGHGVRILNEAYGPGPTAEYRFASHLRRLMRTEAFDIVHASTPVIGNRLARLGWNYVYTSHSRHWFWRVSWRHRWGLWLERRAVRRSAATIAVTPELEAVMRQSVQPLPSLLRTIPYGIDSTRWSADWSRRDGRSALGVGLVLPLKGWELAAAGLRGTGIRLRIAGPSPDAEYAQRVRAAGDLVELLGEVPEERLRDLYASSDFLVHPSQGEVLPRAVLEAMASGLPVLGSAAIGSLLSGTGAGWASSAGAGPAQVSSFIRAHAEELAGDSALRRKMGDAAQSEVRTRYAWSRVVAEHLEVYRQVAGRAA